MEPPSMLHMPPGATHVDGMALKSQQPVVQLSEQHG
jgi:hypothetical protein